MLINNADVNPKMDKKITFILVELKITELRI